MIKCKSTVSQILTSVKEITPVTRMLNAKTPLDHTYVNVSPDILEMGKTAQVSLIYSLQHLDTFDYSSTIHS